MAASRQLIAAAIALVLCASATAQVTPHDAAASVASRIKAASVRVRTDAPGDAYFYGSGVCVVYAERPFVVTNYHVVEGADGPVEVHPIGGTWAACVVVATDTQMDVAVLDAGKAVATHIAAGEFHPSHRYEVAGFAGDGKYHTHKLKPRKWTGIGPGRYSWVELTGTCCQGDSGGGIFNARGEVVGVVWGRGEQGGPHVMAVVGLPFRNAIAKAAEETQ